MKSEQLLEGISKKLDILISLSLKRATDEPTIRDGIRALAPFGLSNGEIATILGTTRRTIEVTKSQLGLTKERREEAKTISTQEVQGNGHGQEDASRA